MCPTRERKIRVGLEGISERKNNMSRASASRRESRSQVEGPSRWEIEPRGKDISRRESGSQRQERSMGELALDRKVSLEEKRGFEVKDTF